MNDDGRSGWLWQALWLKSDMCDAVLVLCYSVDTYIIIGIDIEMAILCEKQWRSNEETREKWNEAEMKAEVSLNVKYA